ncbi:MAG TPA: hypothetical protein VF682_20855 [Pseudomonas sp.]|jgi:hypothetical protein
MLIPVKEIWNNTEHGLFKASSSHALTYQLEKVLFLTRQVESALDEKENDLRWYFTNNEFFYQLDGLINSLSTLAEYYHSWVIFSHIGTNTHKKTRYVPLRRDAALDREVDKLFKATGIGVLSIAKIDPVAYYDSCRRVFLQAYDFLLVGKFYEIFVINNYLKHNTVATGYAPKAYLGDQEVSIPYLYINVPQNRLLNDSVYKALFDYEFDELKKLDENSVAKDRYFTDIVSTTARSVCIVGGYKVYNINGIDYLKSDKSVGVSIESVLEVAQELVSNIVDVFSSSSEGHSGLQQKYDRLKNDILTRQPKTLSRLVAAS